MTSTYLILTGGRSSRFGSDKSQITIEGQTLINRLLKKLPAGEIVIVGPYFEYNSRPLAFALENPPGGGPVAAIAAGLKQISSEEVIVIAVDMPFASEMASILLSQALTASALIPVDEDGRLQPLCALYRVPALDEAIRSLGNVSGKSMREIVGLISYETLIVESEMMSKLIDIDTKEDLEKVIATFESDNGDKAEDL